MGCSVMIIAKNESKQILDCLASCAPFATEYVIVDDFSSDDMVEKIRNSPWGNRTRIMQRSLDGDWGAQQTFGIRACQEDWVFLIDADERCSEALAKEVAQLVNEPAQKAYWVTRINHFAQRRVMHGPLSPDGVLRLVPQSTYVEGRVHPKICVSVPEDHLQGTLTHYTYQDWAHYERKMNLYSTLAAQKYFEQQKSVHPVADVVLRPAIAFLKMYLLKGGFLEGTLGFMLCMQYANYTMAKYIKLAELTRAKGTHP